MSTKQPEIQSHKRFKYDTQNSRVQRKSDIPIKRLHGHHGEVLSCNFHPGGDILLSSGADSEINMWKVFEKDSKKTPLLGHRGPVMDAHFSKDGENIFSCSIDQTVAIWDTFTGIRLRQLIGHSSFVNSVNSITKGMTLLCSGSEDHTVRIWDERRRDPVHTLNTNYPITSTCFTKTGDQVIFAGNDKDLTVWEIRMNTILTKLKGHSDTITGIALSHDGTYLVSNSMDNSVRIWDLTQSLYDGRCLRAFDGIQHGFADNLLRCSWSRDCSKIAAGSSDNFTYVWDTLSQQVLYKIPGPKESVNDVDFHPTQPIIVSASNDQTLYMGVIENE